VGAVGLRDRRVVPPGLHGGHPLHEGWTEVGIVAEQLSELDAPLLELGVKVAAELLDHQADTAANNTHMS